MKRLPLAAVAIFAAWPAFGQAVDVRSAALQMLWSMPVTANPPAKTLSDGTQIQHYGTGVVLENGAMAPDGKIYLLGYRYIHDQYYHVLMANAAQAGLPRVQTLNLGATRPAPSSLWYKLITKPVHDPSTAPEVLGLAADRNGALWIGGITNIYSGLDSDSHANAYLAKLDDTGRLIWERAYDGGDYPFVDDIVPLQDGNVAVAASEGGPDESWLALISGRNGRLIRQARMWNMMDATVLQQADSLLVAAFTSAGADSSYVQDVSVQTMQVIGQSGAPAVIRRAINREDGGFSGELKVAANTGGAYILSAWDEPVQYPGTAPQFPELANVSAGAKLLWQTKIPDVWSNEDAGSFCGNFTMARLAGGDALLACRLNGRIHLYDADAVTGDFQEGTVPLPACSDGNPSLMLFVRPDDAIFLASSPQDGNQFASCTWLAQIVNKVK